MALYNGKQLVDFGNYIISKNATEVTHAHVMDFHSRSWPNFSAAFQPEDKVKVGFSEDMTPWEGRINKVHVFNDSHSYDIDVVLPSGEKFRLNNVSTVYVWAENCDKVNTPVE